MTDSLKFDSAGRAPGWSLRLGADLVEKAKAGATRGKLPTEHAPVLRPPDRTCDTCAGSGRVAPLVICRPCGGSGWQQTWEDRIRQAIARSRRNA